jgi:phenylalanyl-tRNA synthetase beta chain
MKVSLNWLAEYVALPPSTDDIVRLLTMAGVEVEGVETRGCAIPQIVVAQIDASEPHPNADRLSVCRVNDGSGAPRQIVCGAKNYKPGDKVPLALPGAVLPGDFKIKVGKLRGVESAGMLCSAKELGLAEDAEGLLILDPAATPGAPIGDLFPADTILDLEVTPNRPDLLGLLGIAREIAALTGAEIRSPLAPPAPLGPTPEVAIESNGSPFYTVRPLRGATVGPAPAWMRARLESAGLRPINAVVDVTNYVMLETGQPLHAFDAARIEGALRVRDAADGETFLALDGRTYTLRAGEVVIADAARPVAIAGVMGGEDSGVSSGTTDLLLESAAFDPGSVRRTSRRLGLSSDSSYRFERGTDPCGVLEASDRAAQLIAEITGATVGPVAFGHAPGGTPPPLRAEHRPAQIPLRAERLAAVLGTEVDPARVDQVLSALGLARSESGWVPPSFRRDLVREIDLIEEIARVVGMEAIPSRLRAWFSPASASDARFDRETQLRQTLRGLGLHEARTLTLVPDSPAGPVPPAALRVRNPMIADQVALRPSLLHGLLAAVGENARAGVASVRLFEIGRVFGGKDREESTALAIVLSGPVRNRTWREGKGRDADLFDVKSLVASALGLPLEFRPAHDPGLALALEILSGPAAIGRAGLLWPADGRALDAHAPVAFAEIDLDALPANGPARRCRDLARYPAVTRDIAMLAPLGLAHADVAVCLAAAGEPLLEQWELFDVFTDPTGAKVPADQKSVAYSFTYRSPERTLTAEEVDAAHGRLKERLKSALGVAPRE